MALNFGYNKPTGLSQTAPSPEWVSAYNAQLASVAGTPGENQYIDPWQQKHDGVDMGNGSVWFANPANERSGTAALDYGFATNPNQRIAGVSSPDVQDDHYGNVSFVSHHVKQGVEYQGQQGFTVPKDQVGNLSTAFVQTGRDNGKFADKSGGLFGGFGGILLGIGLAALGVPQGLSLALGGGTAGAIGAGAILGAGTSLVTGGDPIKGAILGGVGGAVGASGAGDTVSNAVGATSNIARTAINYGVTGAATGAVHGLLSGGGFGSVISDAAKGATVGAAGGAARGALQDAGVTSSTALDAGGSLAKTAATSALTHTPDIPNTVASTLATTPPRTMTSGVSFGSIIPTFQPTARQNINWGTRLTGT